MKDDEDLVVAYLGGEESALRRWYSGI